MIQFRSEITPLPLRFPLNLRGRMLSIGSCFSEQIAGRLQRLKCPIAINPFGVLFNPLSIASALWRMERGELLAEGELRERNGVWFHHDFHGRFSGEVPDEVLGRINRTIGEGHKALHEADALLVTFGTARIYEREGRVVANCHKEPRDCFRSRMLGVEEIVAAWSRLLAGPLRGRRIVLTLSPIRHLSDGAEQNSLSKAILRVAIAQLAEQFEEVEYFPAYELLMDDLRDYRFYAEDLSHPSSVAVDYIWERFVEWAFRPADQQLLTRIGQLVRAVEHRPLHPRSDSYRSFCREHLVRVEQLARESGFDFSEERAFFAQSVE